MTEKYKYIDDLARVTNDHSPLRNPYKVMKKPILINAYRITWDDFEVETLEGTMKGRRGDWLMIGVSGELYVCKNEIFEKTYDVVEDPD